jgi:hypothetical protein
MWTQEQRKKKSLQQKAIWASRSQEEKSSITANAVSAMNQSRTAEIEKRRLEIMRSPEVRSKISVSSKIRAQTPESKKYFELSRQNGFGSGHVITDHHKKILSSTMTQTAKNTIAKGLKWGGGGLNKGKSPTLESIEKGRRTIQELIRQGKFNPALNGTRHNNSWVDTRFGRIHCLSSWESTRIKKLNSIPWISDVKKDEVRIPYFDKEKNRIRIYIVDFLITYLNGSQVLEEVKPEYRCKTPQSISKFDAAKTYAENHGMIFRVVDTVDKLWRLL